MAGTRVELGQSYQFDNPSLRTCYKGKKRAPDRHCSGTGWALGSWQWASGGVSHHLFSCLRPPPAVGFFFPHFIFFKLIDVLPHSKPRFRGERWNENYQYSKTLTFYLKLVAPLQKLLAHKIHYPAGINGPVGKAERKIWRNFKIQGWVLLGNLA